MWDDTAASRQWGSVTDPFYLGYAAAGALSLSGLGWLYRVGALGALARGALVQGTKARTWAAYNVYKEAGDIKHWLQGGEFDWGLTVKARPISTWYFPYPLIVPFPWVGLNPVDGSSSQGLVQNGGPSAPPPLVQRGTSSDILSLGKISRPQSAHGRSPRASAARRQRCPPGHRWNRSLGKCVPVRKR